MGGVMVSAKPESGTITTRCLPMKRHYYFRTCRGKIPCWRRPLSFAPRRARSISALQRARLYCFADGELLSAVAGNTALSALPEDNEQDKRMKVLVRNNWRRVSHPSYVLQHRFDELGGMPSLKLMKNVNVYAPSSVPAGGAAGGILAIIRGAWPPILPKPRPGENDLR